MYKEKIFQFEILQYILRTANYTNNRITQEEDIFFQYTLHFIRLLINLYEIILFDGKNFVVIQSCKITNILLYDTFI